MCEDVPYDGEGNFGEEDTRESDGIDSWFGTQLIKLSNQSLWDPWVILSPPAYQTKTFTIKVSEEANQLNENFTFRFELDSAQNYERIPFYLEATLLDYSFKMEHLSLNDIQTEFDPSEMREKQTVCFKIGQAAEGMTASSTIEFQDQYMCFLNFTATSQLVNFVYRRNTLSEFPQDPYGVYIEVNESGMPLKELNSNQQCWIKRW